MTIQDAIDDNRRLFLTETGWTRCDQGCELWQHADHFGLFSLESAYALALGVTL